MAVLHRLVEKLGQQPWLDQPVQIEQRLLQPLLSSRPVKDVLNGTWLGHPLHPLLVVTPIGAWLAAGLLDLSRRRDLEPAADRLVLAGVIATVPTTAAGAAQWYDTGGAAKRVGLVHAVVNVTGLLLQVASLSARRNGRRGRGVGLSAAALVGVGVGGYLGGHLSYALGIGVDHSAFRTGPQDWTRTDLRDSDVVAGKPQAAHAGDIDVMVARHDGRLVAYQALCPHAGGPLAEGEVHDGCVVCPWHGSVFDLATGAVRHSPAVTPLSRYAARVVDGFVEVGPLPV